MKYKLLTLTIILLNLSINDVALAEKSARSGAADSRIKTFTYHESDVYKLRGHYGYSTVIELSSRETIESVSIGDSEAGRLSAQVDQIFYLLSPSWIMHIPI